VFKERGELLLLQFAEKLQEVAKVGAVAKDGGQEDDYCFSTKIRKREKNAKNENQLQCEKEI
jgi:hypothetical protein